MSHINCIRKLSLISALVIGLSACGGSSSSDSQPVPIPTPTPTPTPAPAAQLNEADVQGLLDAVVSAGVPGVTMTIDSPVQQYSIAAGVSSQETLEPLRVEQQMPAGSAGKLMIATLVMQLVEQDRLSLQDTLTDWLDEDTTSRIAFANEITVRHLLGHTSGIFEYLHNPQAAADLFAAPEQLRGDAEILQYFLDQPATFSPGASFSYSNSNYVLLGLIVDAVLEEHHAAALRANVIDPVFMDNTYYLGFENDRGEIVSGYRDLADLGFSETSMVEDVKPLFANLGLADAPVASTTEDMSRFLRSLGTENQLLSEQSINTMLDPDNLSLLDGSFYLDGGELYYGLGVFMEQNTDTTLFHHGGDQFGWLTHNVFHQEKDTVVTVMLNCGGDECGQLGNDLVRLILADL